MKQQTVLLVAAMIVCVGLLSLQVSAQDVQTDKTATPFDSPLPTPPTPVSPEALLAIQFVAQQHKIPVEQLSFGSEEPVTFPLLERNYVYVTVHYNAPAQFHLYSVLVDPVTKTVEPDYNAVRAAEHAAYYSKYGKFEPALYDRLQQISEDELLPVTIWAAHTNEDSSYEQIVAEVISRYPEAEETFNETSVLWMVKDANLSMEIRGYYEQLLKENAVVRLQPIITWIEAQGFAVEEFSGLPAVAATLSKRVINELEKHDEVATIFLTEVKLQPESNIAIPTDRVPQVWARGIKGSGIRIAILELDNINATADTCLDIYRLRASTPDLTGHKSKVASVAACNDPIKRGVAYDSQIIDAGHNGTQGDAINALIWATETEAVTFKGPANVVNWSQQAETDTALHFTDRAYDYYVRIRYFTGTKSAGNIGPNGNVTSPGKGYNIITVGNADDKNTSSWSDDNMDNSSSSINPNTNLEKPEVAAPGIDIDTIAGGGSGTSLSAPQVAGLAALLMQRDSDLISSPSAVKAIIMASAVHNIEGDQRLSGVDGAGAIDAALADWIAQNEGNTTACNSPCWWSLGTNLTPSNGSYVERSFNASRGERIRVAIAWLSKPEPPTDTSPDSLLRNFDLYIIPPSGSVSPSESLSNNFEMVDFVAPATGQYTIRVIRNTTGDGGAELGNKLGIAWVKDATYLPDLRNNNSGWTSSIYVRNNGPLLRSARITFFNTGGGYNTEANTNLQPNALWLPVPPANWQGTAIVDGGEDLAVAVRNDGTGISTLDTGFVAGGSGDPAFEVAATTLYGPVAYNNIFGGLNSTIYVQNTSKDSNSVTVYFYGRASYGDYISGWVVPLNANGSGALSTSTVMGSTPWVGSMRIVAGQPVAVKIYESQGSTTSRTFGAAAGGNKLTYVAAVYKNSLGFSSSGLVIQNLGATDTTAKITYCDRASTPVCYDEFTPTILSQRSYGINVATTTAIPDAMWNGSVKIESQNNLPLAVAVTNAKSVGGYDISGVNFGSPSIVLPRAAKNPVGGRNTGFTVRNVTNENNVSVTVTHYDTNGNPRCPFSFSLNAKQSTGYYQGNDTCLPATWEGSIVLEATRPIIAIMREDTSSTTAGYNGIGR